MRGELIYANPKSSSKKKSNSMTIEDVFFVCVNTIYDSFLFNICFILFFVFKLLLLLLFLS